jgi:uncharacterized membrane protein
MNKQDFVEELRRLLSDLPWEDAKRSIEFYSEMIDDLVEEGKTEEEAVASVGTPAEVAAAVRAEFPADGTLPKEEAPKKKRKIAPWVWVLLILGSPVWGSLLIALVSALLCFCVGVLAMALCLWSAFLAPGAAAILLIAGAAVAAFGGNLPAGGMMLGAGLFCAGISILFWFFCLWVTKVLFRWGKKGVEFLVGLKKRREEA